MMYFVLIHFAFCNNITYNVIMYDIFGIFNDYI